MNINDGDVMTLEKFILATLASLPGHTIKGKEASTKARHVDEMCRFRFGY